jgi:hypothetical protein
MKTALTTILFAILPCVAMAQNPNMLNNVAGPATADRAVSPGSGIDVQASTDDSNASIKISSKPTGPQFRTWQAVASAPLSKGGSPTDIVTAQGFPDSFTLTAKLSNYKLAALSPKAADTQTAKDTIAAICADVMLAAKAKNLADDTIKKLTCATGEDFDLGEVGTYAPQDQSRAEALLFDPTKSDTMWGATATAGYRSFDYLQTTGDQVTVSRTPLGASVFFGIIPPRTLTLFTAGLEYRRKYKEADSGAVCPPSTTQCKTGAVGAPTRTNQKLAYLETRRLMGSSAASLKTGYDFASHHWSADLPVYLIATDKGALAGGVRASWEQTKKWQFGVFVSAFSLFPF